MAVEKSVPAFVGFPHPHSQDLAIVAQKEEATFALTSRPSISDYPVQEGIGCSKCKARRFSRSSRHCRTPESARADVEGKVYASIKAPLPHTPTDRLSNCLLVLLQVFRDLMDKAPSAWDCRVPQRLRSAAVTGPRWSKCPNSEGGMPSGIVVGVATYVLLDQRESPRQLG